MYTTLVPTVDALLRYTYAHVKDGQRNSKFPDPLISDVGQRTGRTESMEERHKKMTKTGTKPTRDWVLQIKPRKCVTDVEKVKKEVRRGGDTRESYTHLDETYRQLRNLTIA